MCVCVGGGGVLGEHVMAKEGRERGCVELKEEAGGRPGSCGLICQQEVKMEGAGGLNTTVRLDWI